MKTYYFLGIGGIGMSALARYFQALGHQVSGYDRTETDLTKELENEGIPVHYEEDISQIPTQIDYVIYTPAIPNDNKEFLFFKENHFPMKKRSEILGILAKEKQLIAVAGSHGKTTVSSMITHLLNQSPVGCNAFLGGISKNINSNYLINTDSELLVAEADEFDRSFLQLFPNIAVVTSTDPDHLDIYGSHDEMLGNFQQFVNQTQENGVVFLKHGLPLEVSEDLTYYTYALDNVSADFYAWNLRVYKGSYYFDFRHPNGIWHDIKMNYPGLHNIENSVIAMAVAIQCGVEERDIRAAIESFSGARRRFDIRINTPEFVFIDDYAHHPKELEFCIESVRHLYPNKRIAGIFQPHLYTRTRDFLDDFAKVLETLDEIILLDIYPARELPIPGISSKSLLNKISNHNKYLSTKEGLTDLILALGADVVLTLGAGDIDKLVMPLEKAFRENLGL